VTTLFVHGRSGRMSVIFLSSPVIHGVSQRSDAEALIVNPYIDG
jgi:hypothetical protein